MTRPPAHRWVVDGIEEGVARIEVDGTTTMALPVWMLPDGAREGQVLRVARTAATGSVTLTITLDASAASAALHASDKQVKRTTKASRKRDPGGDVSL